ncbi:MAG: hypothetical protein HUU29_06225 [Planctomycetaceae bacterium]|nr:hypothetical protein [Planctomycetaceae bacterium]
MPRPPENVAANETLPAEPIDIPQGMLEPNCAVAGIVWSPDGAPAPGMQLSLVIHHGERWTEAARAVTEADGRFGIGKLDIIGKLDGWNNDATGFTPVPLQPGRYRLEVRPTPAQLKYAFTASEFELVEGLREENIQLRDYRNTEAVLYIQNSDGKAPRQIHVTWTARDGGFGGAEISRFDEEPAKGVNPTLRLGERRNTKPVRPDNIDPNKFLVKDVPQMAAVTFTVTQSNYTPSDPPTGEVTLDLSDGVLKEARLTFEPRSGDARTDNKGSSIISGQITHTFPDETLGATRISLAGPTARPQHMAKPDGSYEISGLLDGDYTVTFTNSKFGTPIERKVSVFGQTTLDIFVSTTAVSFNLITNGVDLVGAVLQAGSVSNPRMFYQAVTAEALNGMSYPDRCSLTPGTYIAELVIAGATLKGAGPDGKLRFTVAEGMSALTVDLEAVATGAGLNVRVLDEDGQGWAGGECRLVTREQFQRIENEATSGKTVDWSGTKLLRLDNLGGARADRIAPGEYMLLIWARSHDPKKWDRAEALSLQSGAKWNFTFRINVKQE